MAIFAGPHAYVSPAWYVPQPSVPTWNYLAVHVYGRPTIVRDPVRVVALLDELVSTFERDRKAPWPHELPADYRDRMIQAIVPFELQVTRLECQFKLSQNRTDADRQRVCEALSFSSSASARELAEWMQQLNLAMPGRAADNEAQGD